MSLYLDTSLLLAAFTDEPSTSGALIWLDEHVRDDLSLSEWTLAEFSSGLGVQVRSGRVAADRHAPLLSGFRQFADGSTTVFPVLSMHFRAAASFSDQHGLALKAGDALHLAICRDSRSTLCTLDGGMAKAAAALGVHVRGPNLILRTPPPA